MKKTIAIICEASQYYGTGHLTESVNLARLLLDRGHKVSIWVNQGISSSLLSNIAFDIVYYNDLEEELDPISHHLAKQGYNIVVFNLRSLQNHIVDKFKDFITIAIDELGLRKLDCNIVINAMASSRYHTYDSGSNTRFYFGPRYLIMSEGFAAIHKKTRIIKEDIKRICISMGGCDRSGATLRIVDILSRWKPTVDKDIIIGGAFPFRKTLLDTIEPGLNFHIYENVSSIESIFSKADIAFTAGGNTLYELACVGTPPIILYEDDHERVNGETFAELGFGFCPGSGTEAHIENIILALDTFNDPVIRRNHSNKGKSIVDGNGLIRIAGIVERLAEDDQSVEALH